MNFFVPLALLGLSTPQVRYPTRPPQGEFILDEAKLLKAEHAAEIKGIAQDVVAKKDAPIVVVTIKSLADTGASGWPIQRYAMNLFAEWSVGRAEWNYGMLLLVSPGDRKARIELGAAWGHMKDPDAQRVMNEKIVPRFKGGDFSGGILEGVKGLRDIALGISGTPTPRTYGAPPRSEQPVRAPSPPPYEPPYRNIGPSGSTSTWMGPLLFGIIAVVGVAILVSFLRRGTASTWGPGHGSGLSSGCMPFGAGCLGAGLGNLFLGGGGRSHYWDDPWHHRGGGGFSGGGSSWGSGSSSSSGSSSWGGGDSGGGFSGGGGATGEW